MANCYKMTSCTNIPNHTSVPDLDSKNILPKDLKVKDKTSFTGMAASAYRVSKYTISMLVVPEMDPYKQLCEVGMYLYQTQKYDLTINVLNAAKTFQTNQKGITMKVLLTLANAYTSLKKYNLAIPVYQVTVHFS